MTDIVELKNLKGKDIELRPFLRGCLLFGEITVILPFVLIRYIGSQTSIRSCPKMKGKGLYRLILPISKKATWIKIDIERTSQLNYNEFSCFHNRFYILLFTVFCSSMAWLWISYFAPNIFPKRSYRRFGRNNIHRDLLSRELWGRHQL